MKQTLLIPGFAETAQVAGPEDYLAGFRRHWLWIVCASIAGLSLAAVYVRFFPDTYSSQAIVRFNPPQVADRYVAANDSMQAEQRLFALTQMLTSAVTARKLIASQGLYPELRRFRTVEDLVPRFQKDLEVQRVNLAGVDPRRALPSLRLAFRYSSPEKARRVLMLMVESIHEANRSYRGDQTNGTTEFLRMQAEEVQARILELETQISELGMFDRMGGDHQWALKIQQLYSVENRLGHVQTSLRNMQRERADLLSDIADQESRLRRVQATVNPKTELPSPELQSLERRAHEARIAYDRLLERYRGDHPDVVDAKVYLDQVTRQSEEQQQKELETARQRARRDLGLKIDTLRSNLASLDRAIADQQGEEVNLTRKATAIRNTTQNPAEDDMEYLRLTREYEVLKEFHRGLVKKQQEANVGAEMERLGRGEAIELVEPPTLPTLASQPVWQVKLFLGWLAGAVLASVFAAFRTARNPVVRREAHLAIWPQFPLLAEVPPALPPPSPSPGGFRIRVRWKKSAPLCLLLALLAAGSGAACSWRPLTAAGYLAHARAAEKDGALRNAMILYRNAIRRDARCAEAHDALARLELEIGEVDQAYSHLLRAVELKPADFNLHLRLADLTFLVYTADAGRSRDNLLELEAVAERLVARWPARPEGYIYQAMALQARHRADKALASLQTAVKSIGRDPSLLTQIASLQYQNGQTAESAALLESMLRESTRHAPAYDLLYLQRMQERKTAQAGEVLQTKWRTLGDLDSGLQLAAHLHAAAESEALDRHWHAVLERNAAEPEALARCGDFWLNRGAFARARSLYEQGLKERSAERSVYITRLAELEQREGHGQEARARLESALAQQPKDPLLQAHRAVLELYGTSEQARAKARLELELILQRMPRSAFVRYHLGRAYLRVGDVVKAEQQFARCVRLDPNYAPGWLALAETDIESGHLATAQERIDRVLAHAPRLPSALLMKSRLQASRGEFKEAGATLDQVAALGASENEMRLRRAELKLMSGDTAEAIELLEAAVRADPAGTQALLLLARAEAVSGKADRALERLSSLASHPAADEPVLAEYAAIAAAAGRYDVAAAGYRRLRSSYPAKAAYRVGLGDTLAMLGRPDEASAEYIEAQKAAPSDLNAWLHFAALESARGRFDKAREAYGKALSIAPGNPLVLNNLAYVLARTGSQLDYALELAQQAEQLLPASIEVQDTLAYIHARRGMQQQALTTLDRMMARSQGQDRAALKLVRDHIGQGQLQAAVREMEAARDRTRTLTGGKS